MNEPSGIHILHVDDEPDFVEFAADMLEREDGRFSVETATSASKGVDRLTADDFDCIISDYQMPGQNGIDFLDTIRDEYPDLPFILYTGKGSEEVASEAVGAGVTDYLQKGSGTSQYTVLANRVTNAVEQYRSRQHLEETEEKLSEIADGTNDVLFMFNGDWSELLFINSAYETVWGGSIAELKANPQSFLNLVHPDDRENARESMERISNGERDVIEYRIQPPEDDKVRWIRGDTKPTLDTDGNVDRIVGSTSDITEQKKREQELQELTDRYQTFVDYSSDIITVTNTKGTITFESTAIERVLGYTPETRIGTDVFEYIHPEDRETAEKRFQDLVNQDPEATERVAVRFEHDDGSYRWLESIGIDQTESEIGGLVFYSRDITERKEREEKYRNLFNDTRDALIVSDRDEAIDCNEQTLELFGFDTVEAFLDYSPWELSPPQQPDGRDSKAAAIDYIETAYEEGVAFFEWTHQRADGTEFPADVKLSRFDYGGESVLLSLIRDITDRKERERELAAAREASQKVIEASPMPIWVQDVEEIVYANEAAATFYGYDDPKSLIGTSALSFVPETHREPARKRINQMLETGTAMNELTDTFIAKDGTTREAALAATPIMYYGEQAIVVVAKDITEQKQRERELQELKERYQRFVEYSSDIVTVTDPDGTITYQSPAVERVLRHEAEDMLGDSAFAYIHPDDRQKAENQFHNVLNQDTESPERIECRFEHADGSYRWLESIGVDLTTSPIDGIVFYSRDISERKANERELKHRNQQLDRFASIVSHDLRNPLNVATGRLELARDECDTPHHEQIETALNRIETIIDDTLTLSRLGDTIEDTQDIDLEAHVNKCWDGVETGACTLDPVAEARRIQADPERLNHVFENLFRNAVEHGDEGVTVSVDLLEDGFAVNDNGPGLSDDLDVFETGETTSAEGTGFGLSIVEEIVTAHGWEIHATESEAGGARFEITGVEFAAE